MALLVAPFRNRNEDDIEELNEAKIGLLAHGIVPFFLPDTLCDVIDDHKPLQREAVIEASTKWCAFHAKNPDVIMVVVGEGMSEGMRLDVEAWLNAGGPAPRNIAEVLPPEKEQ